MSVASRTRYWEDVDKALESDWKIEPQLREQLIGQYSSEIEVDFESGEDAGDAAFNVYKKMFLWSA